MGDETRLRVIQVLLGGERCACALVPSTGKSQPTVSRHLKILENFGVVKSRRDGVNIWYRLKSKETIQVMKILKISKIENKIRC
jgi:ArsR family transcriptional regulator